MADDDSLQVEGEEGGEAEKQPSDTGSAQAAASTTVVGAGESSLASVIRLEDVFNTQVLAALVAGELLNFCWYSDFFPWGSWHTRSFTSALFPDIAIAVILGLITSAYAPINDHLAAANLSVLCSLLYVALEGTHTAWYPRNLAVFATHGVHKFLLLFAMATAMMYVRTIVEMNEFPDVFPVSTPDENVPAAEEGEGAEAAEEEADEEQGAQGDEGEAEPEAEGDVGEEE